jgi:uncharacterized protein YciW
VITHNYRAADLSARQKAMLEFAAKLTEAPDKMEESDREALRRVGFNDRDIWDIAAVAGFYNMTNRLASASEMRPNREYHHMARSKSDAAAAKTRPPTQAKASAKLHQGTGKPRPIPVRS